MGSGSGNRRPSGGHSKSTLLAIVFAIVMPFLILLGSAAALNRKAPPVAISDPSLPVARVQSNDSDTATFSGASAEFPSFPSTDAAAASGADSAALPSDEPVSPTEAVTKNDTTADVTLQLRPPDTGNEPFVQSLLADNQPVTIRYDSNTGNPAFITGKIETPAGTPEERAVSFFSANRDSFRMSDPATEFAVEREEKDELGMTHLHMTQLYRGLPVFASDMSVHFDAEGRITTVNGSYLPAIEVEIEPQISAESAIEAARQDLGSPSRPSDLEPPELMILATDDRDAVLTWKITLTGEGEPLRTIYFIDAHSGKVASKLDAIIEAKNRRTYTASNGSSIPGTQIIAEGGSSSDTIAQNAHNNIGWTYDYYFATFSRDSFNNGGASLTSTVHYGSGYNNAFWNGYQMVYGDGDGYVFSPLGNSLDVVAHELTHAVTQYSADLVYSYQSGALNESYSDVFGVMVDRNDWLLGEDVYTPGTPGDALRSISNPTQFGQPDHMNSYFETSGDNGGVHTNSGITNKAAYNVAMAIGKEKMERVWYRTLTVYLNSGSQFADARDASVQAAADLYGSASAEVSAVANGFAAVGLGQTQQSEYSARVEVDHTYRSDLVVTVGVGDPANPTWSTVVSNRSGGSADNVYSTVDITAGAAYLPPSWQNRWFLKVYDAAGYDEGVIRKFSITDRGTTYSASDLPIDVIDYGTSVSYIPTQDSTPPAVASVMPESGATAYYSSSVSARFSEDIDPASLDSSSFMLTRHADGSQVPAQPSYDSASFTASLEPDTALSFSTVYDVVVTSAVSDRNGNPLVDSYSWTFTTAPPPRNYYFSWYDQRSTGMRDWVVVGQPGSGSGMAAFDIHVASQRLTSPPVTVGRNQTAGLSFPSMMGGPVKVEALDGVSQIVSRRTLFGDSLEEINGIDEASLTSRYYFAWYDTVSPGARNWILIANPGSAAIEADVFVAGQKMNLAPYNIDPGSSVTPEFAGVIGGPVEVVAYQPGNPGQPMNVLATERVLWKGNFNELAGIPADDLASDYMFTWYDQASAGVRTWVLVSNPDPVRTLAVEISVAGEKVNNSATGDQYYLVAPGQSITPSFPGVINGPVQVKGYEATSYNPVNPGVTNMEFYSTQRSLFGNSFGEIAGFGVDKLRPQYFFSWYDQVSAGVTNWVLVSNPNSTAITAEIWIAGQKLKVLTIAAGETQTPTFPEVMNGPVEVRGYDAATYNPAEPGSPNRNLLASQRVMWKGHFNEVEGQTLQ